MTKLFNFKRKEILSSVAFIFSNSPHGDHCSREGLDYVLASSLIFKKIGLFFIGDGVFQIFKDQQPKKIFSKSYISLFFILSDYNFSDFFVCLDSLSSRGIKKASNFLLKVQLLNKKCIIKKINKFDIILNF
ncbi:sulfurtransferase complex subunit TusC [Buchnera aphidicola (Mindarus keteleerifoliae)]|uniref:sulfurtransferase complex subunit TusC n=1 Tax=Buchnera aphidicola TaxID=9 RepID=UPI0031B707F0